MKLIDVIIPAYKAQETLPRLLGSLLSQTIIDQVHITIVNDADPAGYTNIIKPFSSLMSIREIKMKVNGGPGTARQFGIDNTSNKYFTCIDADDSLYNAFALELLMNQYNKDPNIGLVAGTFFEHQKDFNFLTHSNDLVWMFGKVYNRSFINKYKVRFNDSRANEDTGYNAMVRLLANSVERIVFIPEPVYIWHWKEDSITRVNNCQYTYDKSFTGFTDNMIYAINHIKNVKPFNNGIDPFVISVMARLYLYYCETMARDPRFVEQNYESCKTFYRQIFAEYNTKYGKEVFTPIYAQILAETSPGHKDFVPEFTIFQFVEKLAQDVAKDDQKVLK